MMAEGAGGGTPWCNLAKNIAPTHTTVASKCRNSAIDALTLGSGAGSGRKAVEDTRTGGAWPSCPAPKHW